MKPDLNISASIVQPLVDTTHFDTSEDVMTPPVSARIGIGMLGVSLGATGYSDYCSKDGKGFPISLRFSDGQLILEVWADINSVDPTHTIDMEGAREDVRKADGTVER